MGHRHSKDPADVAQCKESDTLHDSSISVFE